MAEGDRCFQQTYLVWGGGMYVIIIIRENTLLVFFARVTKDTKLCMFTSGTTLLCSEELIPRLSYIRFQSKMDKYILFTHESFSSQS